MTSTVHLSQSARGKPTFAVIDTETSGLSAQKHRIVEVAACITDEEFNPLTIWHTTVNPQAPVNNGHIHGLGLPELAGSPTFGQVAVALSDRLDGLRLIAHNATFDAGFLNAEYARLGTAFCTDTAFAWIDSLRLARTLLKGSHKLDALCQRFNIVNPHPHSALGDALSTAQVLKAMQRLHPDLNHQVLCAPTYSRHCEMGLFPPQQPPQPRGQLAAAGHP